ncbi:oxidoreductase, NAD-binding domain protein [delta proteobacterium NaphS2]|nr:oxidoreductase, NAD-binding domain protein [delta proteobacterium NaphS2]
MYNIGVIGAGYWGPNLIRNFTQLERSNVLMVSDLRPERLGYIKSLYPSVETTTDYEDIINNEEINAVAIATPVFTHKDLAIQAMEQDKHVFVEKPIAASVADTREMIELADKKGLSLMVGHTFEYNPAVIRIKEIIDSGELGEIYYINSQRLNLGLFQQDINVVWDLAPHDISIILYWLGREPKYINTIGASHINPAIQDVATLSMTFDDRLIAFVQCSWLDPNKTRKITVVGSKKMLVYDDIEANNKIWIFDKGVEKPDHYDTFAEFQYSYRYGDISIPRIDSQEPLKLELSDFIASLENGNRPKTDGRNGLRVVKILEAAQHSIDNAGKTVLI